MKIDKVKSREYKGKPYYKYRVIVPEGIIKDSGFKVGDELEAEAKKGEKPVVPSMPPNNFM